MQLEEIIEDKKLTEIKKILDKLENKKTKDIISSLKYKKEPKDRLKNLLKEAERIENKNIEYKIKSFETAFKKSIYRKPIFQIPV